jgi:phospholipid/cholesterol/gamma-HCH transport system ATP-binding protein
MGIRLPDPKKAEKLQKPSDRAEASPSSTSPALLGKISPGLAITSTATKRGLALSGGTALDLEGVSLAFDTKVILDGFSLSLPTGKKISLVGESSCGKSTLLKVAVGLIPPDKGKVRLFGQDLGDIKASELEELRRHVGMQFQAGALFDSMNVRENLALASLESSRSQSRVGRATVATEADILDILGKVGLKKAALQSPASLSGGMKKRAAIARALITKPDLAIFDEPTAGLDPLTSLSIIRLLNELSNDLGAAMILATTDVEVAKRFSGDIVILHEGKIQAWGTFEELLVSPDPYVQKFLKRLKRHPA